MGRFSERDARDMGVIEHALATIDDRSPHVLRTIVAPLRELLRTDVGCAYMLMPRGDGLELEHFHTERWPGPQRAKSIFNDVRPCNRRSCCSGRELRHQYLMM